MTDSIKVCKRVITCQGSLQFITALSVVLCRTHEYESKDPSGAHSITYQDYLVIYDVSPDFAAFIRDMASSIWEWQQIIYLQSSQIQSLAKQLLAHSHHNLCKLPELEALRTQIGVQVADEIYLCRNWQTGNQILSNAYARAVKIAYGDGIGYYFGPERFQPKLSGFRSFKSNLRSWLAPRTLPTVEFDCGYFLLPKIFKETPPMPVRLPEQRFIETVLQWSSARIPQESRLSIELDRPTFILLVGNFAPAWTTLEQEISAYTGILLQKANREALIIVKPHPRSSPEDIQLLSQALRQHFPSINILKPPSSYIPIEVLLFSEVERRKSITVIGFTTACVPLVFLYGIHCIMGFGDCLLQEFFPSTRNHMQENEVLLQEVLTQLARHTR
jgi:hypothetical protein